MTFTNEKLFAYKFCCVGLLVALGVTLLPFYFQSMELDRKSLELISLFTWLFISATLPYLLPKGIWSSSYIFFTIFSIFHGGLVFVSAVDMITDKDILVVIKYWFHLGEATQSIYLINFSMIIYAITVIILSRPTTMVTETANAKLIKRFHHIGGAMLIVMVGIFFIVGFATGALQSYSAYLNVVHNNPAITAIFVYMYMLIGIAIVFISASYRTGYGYLYFIIFAIWAAIAFKIGLRGEVMFPSAVAAAMAGRRRIPISTAKLSILIISLLVAIVVVKNARLSGDYSKIDNMNPLNAIAEMGSSLRTVQEVIKWRREGYQRLYGASYWAPFERQIALFLPIERLPAKKDKRLLNVVVQEKAGPIGFSPVAEAYTNFGEKGIILMAIILGAIFAKFDKVPSTIRADVMMGVTIIPLFVMIRNSFTFIPVQIILGLVIATIIIQLAKIKLES